jgi:hypothetical protein
MLKNLKAGLIMSQLLFQIRRLRNPRIGTMKKMVIGFLHQFLTQSAKKLLVAANGNDQ